VAGVGLEHVVGGDACGMLRRGMPVVGHLARELEGGERSATVTAGKRDDLLEGLVGELVGPREAVLVAHGAAKQHAHGLVIERLELDHPRTRDERGVDLEVGILGGGTDEDDGSVLHRVEEGILLRAVEAVDLVDEEYRAAGHGEKAALGGVDLAAEVLDRTRDGRDLHELGVRGVGDDARERGLARTGRTVEDDRREGVVLDGTTQPRSVTHRLLLSDVPVEGLRTHAHGKRCVDVSLVALYVGEEVVHANDCTPSRPRGLCDHAVEIAPAREEAPRLGKERLAGGDEIVIRHGRDEVDHRLVGT